MDDLVFLVLTVAGAVHAVYRQYDRAGGPVASGQGNSRLSGIPDVPSETRRESDRWAASEEVYEKLETRVGEFIKMVDVTREMERKEGEEEREKAKEQKKKTEKERDDLLKFTIDFVKERRNLYNETARGSRLKPFDVFLSHTGTAEAEAHRWIIQSAEDRASTGIL